MEKFKRNPSTLEDSWWDGPERFQWVNRTIISGVQNEDFNKFLKIFAPKKFGLDIGGIILEKNQKNTWVLEKKPFTLKLNLKEKADIQARAESLPFHNETFGYIVSFHTFEHIKGNLYETLKEWLRVLVPSGLLGIVMPDKRYFLHNPKVIEEGVAAYREMEPKGLLDYFSSLSVEVLMFDSRKNNFDFDIIVKKKKKKI